MERTYRHYLLLRLSVRERTYRNDILRLTVIEQTHRYGLLSVTVMERTYRYATRAYGLGMSLNLDQDEK